MMKNILYRVDGGRVWGVSMGHVKRALLVAEKIPKSYNIIFVMKDYPDGVSYVRDKGFEVETISRYDNSDETLISVLKKYAPLKVLFDLKENPYEDLYSYTRKNNIETIVFDILGKCRGAPDVLINDSFVPEFTSYPFDENNTRMYLGPEYFLCDKLPEPQPLNRKADTIAVTMGGSDPAGLTVKIVDQLIELGHSKDYIIILGPLFPEKSEKEIRTKCVGNKNFKIVRDPPNFLHILASSDLIMTAAGRTLYECALLGRPALVIPSIEHEDVTAKRYELLTGCLNMGLWNDNTPNKISNSIKKYENYKYRKSLSLGGQKIVDGKADKRIIKLLDLN
jgi:UDP-2,4-diacetamido-2,4,6-trideoxy-beta-L-altropyranose hydrolase